MRQQRSLLDIIDMRVRVASHDIDRGRLKSIDRKGRGSDWLRSKLPSLIQFLAMFGTTRGEH